MKFIDTHTHINLRAFAEDAAEAVQRAHEAGVAIVNVGTQIDTSRQAVDMLKQFPENVYAVIGLHPSHAYDHGFEDEQEVADKTREEFFDAKLYKQLVEGAGANASRIIGIGECGLDYYRLPEDGDINQIKLQQLAAFTEQINLALDLNKALCVHCRPSDGTDDAYEDMLKVLTKFKTENPNLRFEIHCFTGSLETAKKFADLGGYIGINGIITFDKTGRSEEVVKGLPLEAMILETDAPYLTPKSNRGKRNESSYLPEVAEKIAEWKSVTVDEVAAATTANAKKLFNL
ncbi:TatD family hydrolase [bacterium]|nr:MAG: TatD family hydrolase [bacterium]